MRTFRRTNTNAVTHTIVNQARKHSVGHAHADASTVYLHAVLPHSKVLRLPGLNYDSAQTYGKQKMIAAALRLFFGQ